MKQVSVNLGYTMNLGNFESLRFDYGLTADVGSGESFDDAFARVGAIVERRLQAQIEEEMRNRNGDK